MRKQERGRKTLLSVSCYLSVRFVAPDLTSGTFSPTGNVHCPHMIHTITATCSCASPLKIFYVSASGMSLATVNLKPLLPGHVLVISARPAATLDDLSQDELIDLWESVRVVQVCMPGSLVTAPACTLQQLLVFLFVQMYSAINHYNDVVNMNYKARLISKLTRFLPLYPLTQSVVENVHGAQASNIGVQDGKDAGQSVPHIHVHIIPQSARA